jgi:eukaryotic-like serine/threonine-protein kinase
VLLLVAVLLAAGVGVGAWWYGAGRYTDVPAVVSLGQADAVAKLEAAGLEAEIGDPAYSETVPAGIVMSADPGSGSQVLDGGTVTLVVSQGQERYTLPALAGVGIDDARAQIEGLNLTLGNEKGQFSETVAAGVVIRSKPGEGTVLTRGSTIDLVVSKGRRPIKVGDWVGESYDEARSTLTDRGLEVELGDEQYSDTVAEGDVIAHDPAGGKAFLGDTVTFTVSLGPELVDVPNVVASGVDAARQELEALGFVVDTQEAAGYLGLGYVFSMDPGGGERVPRGSTITLSLI